MLLLGVSVSWTCLESSSCHILIWVFRSTNKGQRSRCKSILYQRACSTWWSGRQGLWSSKLHVSSGGFRVLINCGKWSHRSQGVPIKWQERAINPVYWSLQTPGPRQYHVSMSSCVDYNLNWCDSGFRALAIWTSLSKRMISTGSSLIPKIHHWPFSDSIIGPGVAWNHFASFPRKSHRNC